MNKNKLVLAIVLLALIVAFFVFDLGRFVSLEYLKSRQADLAALYEAKPALVIGGYALAYILVFALSLPVGAVMTLAGGAIFGLLVGTIVVSFASSHRRHAGLAGLTLRAARQRAAPVSARAWPRSTRASRRTARSTCSRCAWCRSFRRSSSSTC